MERPAGPAERGLLLLEALEPVPDQSTAELRRVPEADPAVHPPDPVQRAERAIIYEVPVRQRDPAAPPHHLRAARPVRERGRCVFPLEGDKRGRDRAGLNVPEHAAAAVRGGRREDPAVLKGYGGREGGGPVRVLYRHKNEAVLPINHGPNPAAQQPELQHHRKGGRRVPRHQEPAEGNKDNKPVRKHHSRMRWKSG